MIFLRINRKYFHIIMHCINIYVHYINKICYPLIKRFIFNIGCKCRYEDSIHVGDTYSKISSLTIYLYILS